MLHILARIIFNALALYAAQFLVPGFAVHGGLKEYALAGAVLGLLNLLVRPVLKFVTFPLIMLTLGLFTFIINAVILWAVAALVPSIIGISGIVSLALATLVVSAVNMLTNRSS